MKAYLESTDTTVTLSGATTLFTLPGQSYTDLVINLATDTATADLSRLPSTVIAKTQIKLAGLSGAYTTTTNADTGMVEVKNAAGLTVATLPVVESTTTVTNADGTTTTTTSVKTPVIQFNDKAAAVVVDTATGGATVEGGTAVVPTFTIAAAATQVTEGSALAFTVTASSAPVADTVLTYQIAGTTSGVATAATPSTDLGVATGTVTILAGQTTGTFSLTPTDDGNVEGYEAFKVSLLDSTFAAVSATNAVVIVDGAPKVTPLAAVLTAGIDSGTGFTGTTANDTFTGAGASSYLTSLDSLDGGAGNDVLSLSVTSADLDTTTASSIVVKNIESAMLTASDTASGGVATDTTAWTGLETLSVTAVKSASVTAATTTDVSANVSKLAGNSIAVQGGNDVTVTANGVTTAAAINVGTTTQPTGVITISSTQSTAAGDNTAPVITVKGGTSVSVTANLTGALDDTVTGGAVSITGGALTTDVSVTQTKAATASSTVAGVVNGAVTVADKNAASATDAGTIATVTLNSYAAASSVDSSALTTLNLSGTAGTLSIGRGALTATPTASELTINVNGLSGTTNTITDSEAASDDGFTTLNINANTAASTISDVVFADATTVNIGGDKALTFTAQTFANATAINITNTAGVSLGTELATGTALTGAAGNDTIKVGATTKSIALGAGDDKVTVSAALGTAGSIDGGEGNDTLKLAAATAVTVSNGTTFAAAISGFERLEIDTVSTTGEVKLNQLDSINYVTVDGVAAGQVLTLSGAQTDVNVKFAQATQTATTVTLGSNGSADVANILLGRASGTGTTIGTLTVDGFETVKFSDSASDTVVGGSHIVTVATNSTTSAITVSGAAGLGLTFEGTALTSFDASAATKNVSFTTAILANSATLTGGTGNDTLNAAAAETASKTISINGGEGSDVITGSASKASTLVGGLGNDIITGGAAADSVDGGEGVDYIDSAAGLDQITTGAGNDIVAANANTNTIYTTIADFAAGDTLELDVLGTVSTTVPTKIALGSVATFSDYVTSALSVDGSTNSALNYFQFGGNTYVTVDNTAATTGFTTNDVVVALSGTVDLSASSIRTEGVTGGFAYWQLGSTQTALNAPDTTGYRVIGTSGADTLTGTNGVDTIVGGAGSDVITGGAGVDVINGGADNDNYIYSTATGDTGSVAASSNAAMSTVALDVITVTAGDTVDLTASLATEANYDFVTVTAAASFTALTGVDGTHVYEVRGTYVGGITNTFTAGDAGSDAMLYWASADGTTANQQIILVGTGAVADTILNGVLTIA